jgi:hypothetical protein
MARMALQAFPAPNRRSSSHQSQMNEHTTFHTWSRRSAPHGKAEDPWVLLEVAAPVLEACFLLLDLLLVAASYYCYCWHCLSACCCYC